MFSLWKLQRATAGHCWSNNTASIRVRWRVNSWSGTLTGEAFVDETSAGPCPHAPTPWLRSAPAAGPRLDPFHIFHHRGQGCKHTIAIRVQRWCRWRRLWAGHEPTEEPFALRTKRSSHSMIKNSALCISAALTRTCTRAYSSDEWVIKWSTATDSSCYMCVGVFTAFSEP